MKNLFYFISIIAISLSAGGCATILTMTTPPVEEITLGKKGLGEEISSNYKFVENKQVGTLLKQPYCLETAQQEIMTRRRMHGVVPALVEIPIYGLGLIDLISAGVYSKASEELTIGNYVETGAIVECGEFKPVPGMTLYVQCAATSQMKSVKTDADGNVDTKTLYKEFYKGSQLNLFVREDSGFAYIATMTLD